MKLDGEKLLRDLAAKRLKLDIDSNYKEMIVMRELIELIKSGGYTID
jgi:hypothetical protein